MKLIRFMGREELRKYLDGETLTNTTNWRAAGSRSDSRGFCFFDDSEPPEKRLPYVSGVVNTDVVVMFETVPFAKIELLESLGTYRDAEKDMPTWTELLTFSNLKMKKVWEYSLMEYSNQILRVLKFGKPVRHPEGWTIEWGRL
jgi:hypothetical protein